MTTTSIPSLQEAPVGVFDSGVGGLSVLRHVREQLPHEHLLYFADSGFAPYGDKPEQVVAERSLAIARFLIGRGAKALVVACNTATVRAIRLLRLTYPSIPIVGVEPGLKPAAAVTRTGKVGVLATEGTLCGAKFKELMTQVWAASNVQFVLQGCPGLADQIELGEHGTPATVALLERFVVPLLDQGADTLVLGCTHYPFVREAIEQIIARRAPGEVTLIDTGDAVARQLGRLLGSSGLARTGGEATLAGYTSGSVAGLSSAASMLLGYPVPVSSVSLAN